jgi:hypothetical protein
MINSPIFHRSKNYLHFTKVEWPLYKLGNPQPNNIVTIEIDDVYRMTNGNRIKVVSMFEGKLYPLINYQNERGKILSASIYWFAQQIANKSEKI